jgi:hypothetical protein
MLGAHLRMMVFDHERGDGILGWWEGIVVGKEERVKQVMKEVLFEIHVRCQFQVGWCGSSCDGG